MKSAEIPKPDWEAFGRDILEAWDFESDVDVFEIQELALEHGLLHPVEVTEACDPGNCRCEESSDFPQKCLRFTFGGRP